MRDVGVGFIIGASVGFAMGFLMFLMHWLGV